MKLTLAFALLFITGISFSQSLLKFSSNEKIGYMNAKGEVKIAPTFSNGKEFSEGLAFVYSEGKIGVINEDGHLVVDYTFDYAYPFSRGVAIVGIDSLYGLIDTRGTFIIPPDFQRLYFQNEGVIGVKKDDLWGFYSTKNGRAITEIKYPWIGAFNDGLAKVQDPLSGKYGFIDKNGQVVIPCSLTQVYSDFNDGFAAVCDSSRRNCYINQVGDNVFNEHYYGVSRFSQGFAFVSVSWESGYFIDQTGKRVSKNNFKRTWNFYEGFCGVETDSSYAVINLQHEIVFESKTIELRFFSNGFGFFCNRSDGPITWGLMDTNMKIISELNFVQVLSIPNKNCVEFYLGDPNKWYGYGKRGYMDHGGNIIWMEE